MSEKGKRYRHWKGGIYQVECMSFMESTKAPMVTYFDINANPPVLWTRPLYEFMDSVTVGDCIMERFEEI